MLEDKKDGGEGATDLSSCGRILVVPPKLCFQMDQANAKWEGDFP